MVIIIVAVALFLIIILVSVLVYLRVKGQKQSRVIKLGGASSTQVMDDTGMISNAGPGPMSKPNFGDSGSEGGNDMIVAQKNPMAGLFKNKDE